MKRSVGIGIGIVIVAILVLVVFSNVDDLVSTNIEDATSQISKNLEESTSKVEFSNPLQPYEVDSRCDFSYLLLDLHYSKKMGVKDTIDIDKDEVLARSEELFKEIQEKQGSPEDFAIKMQRGEINEETQKKIFENARQSIFEEFLLYPVMENNSIHPKLKNEVSELLNAVGEGYISTNPTRNPTYYKFIKITDDEFNSDPECAKKHREHFSETMTMLKNNWGY